MTSPPSNQGKRGSWVGSRLAILPHESTVSVQLRVGFSNGLRAADVRRIFDIGTKNRSSILPMPRGSSGLGLSLPPDEVIAMETLGVTGVALLGSQFRFCPDCLAGGYHSYLFQLKPLEACPAHNTRLMKECCSCAAPTLPWRNATQYVDYKCPACSKEVNGMPLSYKELLENRPESTNLTSIFEPLQSWMESLSRSGIRDLCAVVRDYAIFVDEEAVLKDVLSRYSSFHWQTSRKNRAMVVGLTATSDCSDSETTDHVPSWAELRENRDFERELFSRAWALIEANLPKAIDPLVVEEIRKTLSSGSRLDFNIYDKNDIALAVLAEYFDASNRPFTITNRWAATSNGLGSVYEPVFMAVSKLPKAWLAVVLAAFGMLREIVHIIQTDDERRARLDIVLPLRLPDGRQFMLTRGMVRELLFASVPVISIENPSSAGNCTTEGIFTLVPYFYGLDVIVEKAGLVQFDEMLRIRELRFER
jgi:hypothetical protein